MAWAPVYATVAELQSFIGDGTTSSTFELTNAIEAASRSVDRICNRQFGLVAAPEQRFYTADYHQQSARWIVSIDDLMTNVGLLVEVDNDGDGIYESAITDYALTPINSTVNSRPWTRVEVRPPSAVKPNGRLHGVRVTAKFGWTQPFPNTIKMATLIQAARLFARRFAPFGISGSPDIQGEMRLLAKLDPDLAVSVQPYIRHWGCA